MKTVLSVFCCLCVVVLFTGCDNGDDGGSSGGPGRWPSVSFTIDDNGNVTCLNADSNTITTRQTCIWNCAYYHISKPRYVQLWFEETQVCEEVPSGTSSSTSDSSSTRTTDVATDTTTGTDTSTATSNVTSGSALSCETKVALVRESFKSCRLDGPPPY